MVARNVNGEVKDYSTIEVVKEEDEEQHSSSSGTASKPHHKRRNPRPPVVVPPLSNLNAYVKNVSDGSGEM